jgi:hypothetical protein
VRIYTKDAKAINGNAGHNEQNKAIETLKHHFRPLAVDVKRTPTEHDRYIEVTRANGSKARMWIGRGLDFIRPNGQTTKTYIVVEDPYQVHS